MEITRNDEPRSYQPDGNDDGIDFSDPAARSYCKHGTDITVEYNPDGSMVGGRRHGPIRCPQCGQEAAENWKRLHAAGKPIA